MSDEREPDMTDDPRKQGTGQGYPEEQQSGANPKEGTDQGPEAGTSEPSSPDSDGDKDSSPGSATGNPGAAGG